MLIFLAVLAYVIFAAVMLLADALIPNSAKISFPDVLKVFLEDADR